MAEIAITIPGFRLLKSADGAINPFDRKNEIHIATLAIDENGEANSKPAIYLNSHSLEYGVKPWEKVDFLGDGRLIYGPGNPGKFVYCTIVFVESDREIRNFGESLQEIVDKSEIKDIVNALSSITNPTLGILTSLLEPITKILARGFQKNQDDVIFTQEGVFLRDLKPAYRMGESFTRRNEFIECKLKVVPLLDSPSPLQSVRPGMKAEGVIERQQFIEQPAGLRLERLAGEPTKFNFGSKPVTGSLEKGDKKVTVIEDGV